MHSSSSNPHAPAVAQSPIRREGESVPELTLQEIVYDKSKDLLGTGGFGSVYRGKCRGFEVAVKVPNADMGEQEIAEFRSEIAHMAALHHPRIALFLGAYIPPVGSDVPVHIVLELCSSDMETLIYKDRIGKKLSLFQRMEWGKQAAEGLAWLHGAGVVHRDVKPTNMLYHAPSRAVKIADFGLAGLLGKGEQLEDGKLVGNPNYWAPEQIERKPYIKATDVYAWAISMYQFIARKDPFPDYWGPTGMSPYFLEAVLDQQIRPPLPRHEWNCPAALRRLIERAWHQDPAQRPTFAEIINKMETDVLLMCAIPFADGARQWTKLAQLRKAVGLSREVHWDDVLPIWAQRRSEMQLDEGSHDLAEYAMYKLFRDGFDPFGHEVTTIQRFGQTLGYFAEGTDPEKFRKSVLSFVRHAWFWGYSSRLEAEMVCRHAPLGTWLVRLAVNSEYRLSIRGKEATQHFRIKHEYHGTTYMLGSRKKEALSTEELAKLLKQPFTSLVDLAVAVGLAIGVEAIPVTRSPFLMG